MKKYAPILLLEAFKSGSHEKVIKLMGKLLSRKAGGTVRFDFDIPFGYQTSQGDKISGNRNAPRLIDQ